MAPQKPEDDVETASWEQDKTAEEQELVEEEVNDFETGSFEQQEELEAALAEADEAEQLWDEQRVEDEIETASWEQDKRKP